MHYIHKIETTAPEKLDKKKIKKETEKFKKEIGDLQNVLYAEGKHSLLIILQGMDASGKDGAIKHIFESMNPQGVKVVSFKKPTELEMKHDFLWRVHPHAPEKGMVTIFNRSHYEDVLIQKVHKWIDHDTVLRRYDHINKFEQMLVENGTVVLKFYLHISPEKQLERLEERLSDDTKKWKHNDADMRERELWNDYMDAYGKAIDHCPTWTIVPADNTWYKEYLVSKTVVEAMRALKMRFPGLKVG